MDTRRTARLAREFIGSVVEDPGQTAIGLAALAATTMLVPDMALATGSLAAALTAFHVKRYPPDPLGRYLGNRTPKKGRFVLRYGYDKVTGAPVELGDDEVRRHALVLGSATSKTDFLLGLCEQAVSAGSGAMLVSAKGDPTFVTKAYAMAKRHGREDGFLLLDLSSDPPSGRRDDLFLSNTFNPLAKGPADALTALVVTMATDNADHELASRTTAMLRGVMRALTWSRDAQGADLDFGVLLDHLALPVLVGIATGSTYTGLPKDVRVSVAQYLSTLPGYNPERGVQQARSASERHSEVERLLENTLHPLVNRTHVFRTSSPDIDMADVVLNRRILVVMLPDLERSLDDLSVLGKVVTCALKGVMSMWLEGVVCLAAMRARPCPSPFLCVLDDVGHYLSTGFAITAARAHSSGIGIFYGATDMHEMRRTNEKEAASIIANTSMKIYCKVEDLGEVHSLLRPDAGHPPHLGPEDGNVGWMIYRSEHWPLPIDLRHGIGQDEIVLIVSDITLHVDMHKFVMTLDEKKRAVMVGNRPCPLPAVPYVEAVR